jgi:short-subunit dehydrogenase
MDIAGSVVLVTGANRGIGAEFVRQVQARGAAKIYAAARRPDSITAEGVEKVALDVTDAGQAAAVAGAAPDVTLVINNAGIARGQGFIDGDVAQIREEFETNFYGVLNVSRAFAPVLAANGGGAILNANSALSWISFPGSGSYSATKAASWSLTDGLRVELTGQGTQVVGLHMGAVDTEMTAHWDIDKVTPEAVVTAALDGIEAGKLEVLADGTAAAAKAGLSEAPEDRYAQIIGAAA